MNPMAQMMAQAQRMQRELTKALAELDTKEFKASKNGMVEVTMLGNRTISSLVIDKDAMDPENAEMLQDAIVSAINELYEKIKAEADAIQEKITGRSGLPF